MIGPQLSEEKKEALKKYASEIEALRIEQNAALEGKKVEEYNKKAQDLRLRMMSDAVGDLSGQGLSMVKEGRYVTFKEAGY